MQTTVHGTMRGWGPVIALAIAVGLVTTPTTTRAQVGDLQIKGKIYSATAGELKVKCTRGHTLDVSTFGQRTFTISLVSGEPRCTTTLIPVSGGSLVFEGQEIQVIRNGSPKNYTVFSGVETNVAVLDGAAVGVSKLAPAGIKKEKGVLTLSTSLYGGVVFIGKYRATFD